MSRTMQATSERRISEELRHHLEAASTFSQMGGMVVEALQTHVGVNGVNVFPLFEGAVLEQDAVSFHESYSCEHMAQRAAEFVGEADRVLLDGVPPERLLHPFDGVADLDFAHISKSRVFNEFFRPYRIERQVLRLIGGADHPLGFICMCRSWKERAFTAADKLVMDGIAAAMGARLAELRDSTGWQGVAEVLGALRSALPVACAVFDDVGRVRWSNDAAQQAMQVRKLAYRGGALRSVPVCKLARWRDTALAAMHGSLMEAPPSDNSLTAAVVGGKDGHRLAVVWEHRPRRESLRALTPREQEVADLMIRGYSVLNAAARLGLAEETVRTHLKRVHRKLGVRTRAQLVAAILRGPY